MQFKVGYKLIFCIICSFRTHNFSIAVVTFFFSVFLYPQNFQSTALLTYTFLYKNVHVLTKTRNELERPETILNHVKTIEELSETNQETLTSPETSQ